MKTESISTAMDYLPDWIISEVLSYLKKEKDAFYSTTSNIGNRTPVIPLDTNEDDHKASNELFLDKVQSVLIEKMAESNFNIDIFSKAVGMSRMQLHRKLKAATGLSASNFIRSQRLKMASQLLKKSDINISEVGYTVGFNDHSYFSKRFKETYNCTPTDYYKKFAS